MPITATTIAVDSEYGVTLGNQLLTHSEGADALVVMFGGLGYTLDAPLFHYIRKEALNRGFDVLRAEYGFRISQNSHHPNEDWKIIADALKTIQQCANNYKKLIFVSKSIGTVIAGGTAKQLGYDKITHVFLTPIERTVPHLLESKGIVFIGTKDKLFPNEQIKQIQPNPNLEIHFIQDADHGLERDEWKETIQILDQVVEWSLRYISAHAEM